MHSLRFFRLFLGVYVHRARALRAYVWRFDTPPFDSHDYVRRDCIRGPTATPSFYPERSYTDARVGSIRCEIDVKGGRCHEERVRSLRG